MGKFTEEDAKDLANFCNFVSKHAKFDVDWAEAVMLAKYSQFVQQLVKKIKDHVVELERVIEPPKKKKGKK